MFCPKCGNSLEAAARFCNKCGTPMSASPQGKPPIPPQQSAPPPLPKPPPQAAPQPPILPQKEVPQAAPPSPMPPQQGAPQGTSNLNYKVFGANLPAISIYLDAGQSIYTQSGGMAWMASGITMQTNMKGGLMKGLGRMLSGDSLFIATYTSNAPKQEIAIASSFPGSIADVTLNGNSVIAQKNAFLCAQPSVTLSAYVTKSIGAGLFGGEGFILQRLSGFGKVFFEIDGSLVERVLAPGEKLKVDTGNVAAFEESVTYKAEMVKGFKNILFGGEGLFLSTLTGPGKVWLQTMTLPSFAKRIIPFMPKSSGGINIG